MTTTNSIVKYFKGKRVRIDPANNYPNLTDMARAFGKQVGDFLRLDNTKDFIAELSVLTGYPVNDLITTLGNTVANGKRGTWAHPQIAIKFAGWLSAKFEVLMTSWIFELLSTGKVALALLPEPQALLLEGDNDIASNMAMAIAPRVLNTENDSAALLTAGWLTVGEILATLGYSREIGSIASDKSFKHWVCKDFCGLYRSRNRTKPPQVGSRSQLTYCYPPAYIPLIEAYLNSYVANTPDKLTTPKHVQLTLLDSIAA